MEGAFQITKIHQPFPSARPPSSFTKQPRRNIRFVDAISGGFPHPFKKDARQIRSFPQFSAVKIQKKIELPPPGHPGTTAAGSIRFVVCAPRLM